jgi:hypothetical protein
MKLTGLLKTSVLISLLGASALIYAQDQKDEAKPEEPRPEATKPSRDEVKPSRQQEETRNPKQDEAKPSRNEEKPGNQENGHNTQRADRRRGGQIPDDKFRAHFGRQHTVVINRPTIVEGQPRFQFGGYWFTIVDAWPGGWAYTDQCYIDYVDGEYFLFDLLHPGVRVALFVVM